MTMISCSGCGGQISDSAISCPMCGHPNSSKKKVGILLGLGIALVPMIFSWFTLRKGYTSIARGVSFGWLALVVLMTMGSSDVKNGSKESNSSKDNQVASNTIQGSTTAMDIAKLYYENTVAADQMFKGKRYMIGGIVSSINTDISGDPYITMEGGVNQFMEPHFKFGKESIDSLVNVRKGAQLVLLCVGEGDIAKTPIWGSCSIR